MMMMQLHSSPSPKPKFTHYIVPNFYKPSRFSLTLTSSSKFFFLLHHLSPSHSLICCSSNAISLPVEGSPLSSSSSFVSSSSSKSPPQEQPEEEEQQQQGGGGGGGAVLEVRRPVMEDLGGGKKNVVEEEEDRSSFPSTPIEVGLLELAKKTLTSQPERVESRLPPKPLAVNLDLALYRAKAFARNFQFQDAEKLLRKCMYYWPEDGRLYVALGKILGKQSKTEDARAVYGKGCQITQGENAYIWQCWAVLENKLGNIRRARELFDAATVADRRHIAAWHGWAVLELKQGNVKKARSLLGKGLKHCGGNEYIYQTLALLEAKANRYEQAHYLFRQATICNPKSCASWLAWAQLEMQQGNNLVAGKLFEKAVQASPKNRFAWHVWGLFEANLGNIEKSRKLLKVGHMLNPRDPVLLQSLAILEYKHSTANLARVLFKRASELDPKHQPVWVAWGWMEWKEGNIATARELYQRAVSIDSTTESAARCLQAWGVLEQRVGNLSAARRLYRSSLNVDSQSYVTWMTWASLEEDQGNSVRADEIRSLFYQQRTEVIDDASWTTEIFDNFVDPALEGIKRLFNFKPGGGGKETSVSEEEPAGPPLVDDGKCMIMEHGSSFDLDAFLRKKLLVDPLHLDALMEGATTSRPRKIAKSPRRVWTPASRTTRVL